MQKLAIRKTISELTRPPNIRNRRVKNMLCFINKRMANCKGNKGMLLFCLLYRCKGLVSHHYEKTSEFSYDQDVECQTSLCLK